MEPVTTINGRMVALLQANIDTDQIIPHRYLKRVERAGFGEGLFHDWAHRPDGSLDPEFPLNRPEHRGATVLLGGPNFGSGSSREHAAWAIQDYGFRAVVAASFADIFRSNSHKIGLLPVVLEAAEVTRLAEMAAADPAVEVTIDLPAQRVTAPGFAATFEMDPFVKQALVEGVDDIDRTLIHADAITAYEQGRPGYRPRIPTA